MFATNLAEQCPSLPGRMNDHTYSLNGETISTHQPSLSDVSKEADDRLLMGRWYNALPSYNDDALQESVDMAVRHVPLRSHSDQIGQMFDPGSVNQHSEIPVFKGDSSVLRTVLTTPTLYATDSISDKRHSLDSHNAAYLNHNVMDVKPVLSTSETDSFHGNTQRGVINIPIMAGVVQVVILPVSDPRVPMLSNLISCNSKTNQSQDISERWSNEMPFSMCSKMREVVVTSEEVNSNMAADSGEISQDISKRLSYEMPFSMSSKTGEVVVTSEEVNSNLAADSGELSQAIPERLSNKMPFLMSTKIGEVVVPSGEVNSNLATEAGESYDDFGKILIYEENKRKSKRYHSCSTLPAPKRLRGQGWSKRKVKLKGASVRGLPDTKPDFTKGPANVPEMAKTAKAAAARSCNMFVDKSVSDSDEELIPYMERMERMKRANGSSRKFQDLMCWLIQRLEPDENSCIRVDKLYAAYQAELDENYVPVTKQMLIEHFTNIFPSTEKKRHKTRNGTITQYQGVKLLPVQMLREEACCTMSDLTKCLSKDVASVECTSNHLKCSIDANMRSNGNKIFKEITFLENGLWSLEVSGRKIELGNLSISNRFTKNIKGIDTVLKIVSLIRLCKGVIINNKTITLTRFQILEYLSTGTEASSRILRSVLCNRVTSLISKTNTCRKCQKMTKTASENVPTMEYLST